LLFFVLRLLDLDTQDKMAAAVVIPPEEAKLQPEEGTLSQYFFDTWWIPVFAGGFGKNGCQNVVFWR
jgi:hypothetical protein